MTIVAITSNNFSGNQLSNSRYETWQAMLNGNQGEAAKLGEYPDRTVQIYGTFGTGGSITIYGSNKPSPDVTVLADWFICHDPQGNNLTFTAAGGKLIAENPLYVSPQVTAGDGTTSLNAIILGKR